MVKTPVEHDREEVTLFNTVI